MDVSQQNIIWLCLTVKQHCGQQVCENGAHLRVEMIAECKQSWLEIIKNMYIKQSVFGEFRINDIILQA